MGIKPTNSASIFAWAAFICRDVSSRFPSAPSASSAPPALTSLHRRSMRAVEAPGWLADRYTTCPQLLVPTQWPRSWIPFFPSYRGRQSDLGQSRIHWLNLAKPWTAASTISLSGFPCGCGRTTKLDSEERRPDASNRQFAYRPEGSAPNAPRNCSAHFNPVKKAILRGFNSMISVDNILVQY